MPFVSPLIEHDVPELVQVFPVGVAVAVYPVIALPPFDEGAVHEAVSLPLPERVAVAPVGAPGATGVEPEAAAAPDVTAIAEERDDGPVPATLPAVTAQV